MGNMLSFYERKKRALELIDETIDSEDTDLDMLEYTISKKYGFSRQMIDRRIALLNRMRQNKEESDGEVCRT
jgi:hypothetical protein